MGFMKTLFKIIFFPFKLIFNLIFGRIKKKETLPETKEGFPVAQSIPTPSDVTADNLKAKVDLMLSQVDGLKIEYEALNQRIQNIERMVKEIYQMAKS